MSTFFQLVIAAWAIVATVHYALLISKRSKLNWRVELPPEDMNRGHNADNYYEAVTVGGVDHWFTVEQILEARVRAEKYKR